MRSPSHTCRAQSKHPRTDEEPNDLVPAKRRCKVTPVEVTAEEEEIYESQILLLREECDKDAPQYAVLKSIMIETVNQQRHWITTELPSVEEVLEKFPPLKMGIKHVSFM